MDKEEGDELVPVEGVGAATVAADGGSESS